MHTTHSQPTMVRETRHLWVGNLPENIREERITEHFKRYAHRLHPYNNCTTLSVTQSVSRVSLHYHRQ